MSTGRAEIVGRRRRRTPEVAEAEIVAAAEALLRERPFRELTVDEVMRRTDLSRPSFYVYFRDRHHLMLRVVEHLGAELRTMSGRWYTGSGDGPAQAREAMEGIVEVYAQHGLVLRALADAAADDPEVERVYGGLVQSFIDATERHIEAEMAAGRVLPLDAKETARALVWMMERYLNRWPPARDGAREGRRDAEHDLDARALRRRLIERAGGPQAGHHAGRGERAGGQDAEPRQRVPGRERRRQVGRVRERAGQQPLARGPAAHQRAGEAGPDRHVAGAEARAEHARAGRVRHGADPRAA